ncbi:unnamed protein product [Mytilus coruscus]|uniref:Bactericidal permeability-increasing protein n=1 Tax=Mytilus coruscus TaxID=42192 RepID=A0A6J8C903_MYTCO|nr:unnamed protein product [Mytilus coruscus]
MWLFISVHVLCTLFSSILATNPGFRLRITEDGLNYANQVAVDLVTKKVKTTKLPDQNGEGKNVKYSLSNLDIRNFQPPTSSITLASESDLQWKATNLALEIDGKFHYKYKKGFIKFSGGGSVNVKFSDISFSVGVNLGVDGSGKPTIKAGKCSCDSGPVKVKFRGGLSWIYNLFSGKVGKIIAGQFQSKMCGIIQNLIDKNAQESLSTIKVEVQLGEFLTLDYRLLAAPTVTSEYIEADLKGEIFWKSDKSEAPFAPPAMATITDNKKMVYITLSEYIFNTMTYQAHQHNILVFNLTSQNIKAKNDALNTTCTDICIGKLIPQIGKSFPNSKVELHMKSSKPPVTSITDGHLGVAAEGDIDLYARKPDKSLHYLFRIAGAGSIAVKLTMNETVIHGSVEDMKIKLNVSKSSIGPVNEKALQFLVDSAIKTTITPMLNDLGTKGFPMPSTDNLKLNQFDFKLLQNTMLIETNLKYIPEPTKTKSTVLKFVPRDRWKSINNV